MKKVAVLKSNYSNSETNNSETNNSETVFQSKKNKVILRNGIVEKHCTSAKAALFEAEKLEYLNSLGVRVPGLNFDLNSDLNSGLSSGLNSGSNSNLNSGLNSDANSIKQKDCIIKMQYIPGTTIPDLLEHIENDYIENQLQKVADAIVYWLMDFYQAVKTKETGEIRGDVNGRNFIFDGEFIWGIDFEEKTNGEIEQDIGRLIAFILTYDPPGTPTKILFADKLMEKSGQILKADLAKVCLYRDTELAAMALRRQSRRQSQHIAFPGHCAYNKP